MERKIVVPEGMLMAAVHPALRDGSYDNIPNIVEAALRWLAENPIVPTASQTRQLEEEGDFYSNSVRHGYDWAVVEWQRRMFLAPEPEIPEAIKDLLCRRWDVEIMEAFVEAYRRGQKAGKQ